MTDDIVDGVELERTDEWPQCVISAVLYLHGTQGFDHLEIEHDGSLRWIDGQIMKNIAFGPEAACFENYPPRSQVLNGNSAPPDAQYRHIFAFKTGAEWPNIRSSEI